MLVVFVTRVTREPTGEQRPGYVRRLSASSAEPRSSCTSRYEVLCDTSHLSKQLLLVAAENLLHTMHRLQAVSPKPSVFVPSDTRAKSSHYGATSPFWKMPQRREGPHHCTEGAARRPLLLSGDRLLATTSDRSRFLDQSVQQERAGRALQGLDSLYRI